MRPSLSALLANLSQPVPGRNRVVVAARNLSLRFIKRQNCCGHPGEPGC